MSSVISAETLSQRGVAYSQTLFADPESGPAICGHAIVRYDILFCALRMMIAADPAYSRKAGIKDTRCGKNMWGYCYGKQD